MRFICSETRNPPPKVDSDYEEEDDDDENTEEEEQEDVEDYKKGRRVFPKIIPTTSLPLYFHNRQVLWKDETANSLNLITTRPALFRLVYFPRPIKPFTFFPLGTTTSILTRFVSECCIICVALHCRFNFKPSLSFPVSFVFVSSISISIDLRSIDYIKGLYCTS